MFPRISIVALTALAACTTTACASGCIMCAFGRERTDVDTVHTFLVEAGARMYIAVSLYVFCRREEAP